MIKLIELIVDDYCQDCCDFEPDVQKSGTMTFSKYPLGTSENIVIRCEHRARCARMMLYLKSQKEAQS